ncbi:hypothetical protein NQ318_015523 [Aromia moschata]|uniref:Uncharacterized protein n=1 Tax=Aromia moschata TaxID=1265417 RepID=A0AAV8XR59_9CUCU|nr:hypothetical protein NQ318_015523 [Aromia moschata]
MKFFNLMNFFVAFCIVYFGNSENASFPGLFCALTQCELEPCAFGACELTNTSYRVPLPGGVRGSRLRPEAAAVRRQPVRGPRHLHRARRRLPVPVPRVVEGRAARSACCTSPTSRSASACCTSPFWLGLMTVFVVMAVIGLVWCAKRHFPEKIEKLLAEEESRNRSTVSSLRSTSVREQLAAAAAAAAGGTTAVTVTPSPGPGAPRSLFGRLGIRKPSILSLTSPHAGGGYVPATGRTFSLDDLLKPPPRLGPVNLKSLQMIPRHESETKRYPESEGVGVG